MIQQAIVSARSLRESSMISSRSSLDLSPNARGVGTAAPRAPTWIGVPHAPNPMKQLCLSSIIRALVEAPTARRQLGPKRRWTYLWYAYGHSDRSRLSARTAPFQ
jgi:hypothetical protein